MELRDMLHLLVRRAWLLMLVTALGVAGSYLTFRYLMPWPRYVASAAAILGDSDLDANWASLQANRELLTTYVRWAERRPVLEGVADALQLRMSVDTLGNRIDAHLVGNTQMIEITVVHDNPQEAAAIANEVVRQLEREVRAALAHVEDLPSPTREEIAKVQEQINSTEARLDALTNRLLEADSTEEADLLRMRVNVLQSQLEIERRRYVDLRDEYVDRAPLRLVVVEEAQPPAQPTLPLPNILISGLTALAATTGAVLLLGSEHATNRRTRPPQ